MMKLYCSKCETIQEAIESKEIRSYQIKDTLVHGEINVLKCQNCGNEIYDKENEIRNDIILFDDYKQKNNLLTSKEIYGIRKKYGLSQTTFSKILGFGLKTMTRYENGSIQDVTHDNLLRLINDENNFLSMWYFRRMILSESENSKIQNKILKQSHLKVGYIYETPTINPYLIEPIKKNKSIE